MENENLIYDGEESSKRIRRTNAEIKKNIFDAVYQIVKEKGFTVLSINLISKYSNVSPLIINKRFKDLDDIIDQFISRWEYWIDLFSDSKRKSKTRDTYQDTLESILDIVWKKKSIQQVLAWEIVEDSPLLEPMLADREKKIAVMAEGFAPLFAGSEYDVKLITAILLSAAFYMAGYKKKDSYFGMNIKGNTGNLKVLEGINQLSNLVFDKIEKRTEKEIAQKMLESGDSLEKVVKITGLKPEELTGS
ncbi:MAG: TetR/AcrR family transcriptional regulator [Tannerella sp.]|jgi:AcrR family transcriptional regulator|nr:TetR/AcrR family transcriptional regulator [Tannerella sp.]